MRRIRRVFALLCCTLVLTAGAAHAQAVRTAEPQLSAAQQALQAGLQAKLDSLHAAGRFAGATAAVALRDGTVLTLATGYADSVARTRMRPHDRMLAGSVGKTFFAALALQLVHEGRFALDDPIARHLGDEPWFRDTASGRTRLPNGDRITVRNLMNHTSGVVRYEFDPAFLEALRRDPYRVWTPPEQLAFILDREPPFDAGAGWEYSDTNYILLALLMEKVTGGRAYDMIRRRLLDPLALTGTIPSTGPVLPGLVQGYAGANNGFVAADAMLANGRLALDPQFEWGGGGFVSSAPDLARWVVAYYEGRAFDSALLPQVLDGVEARGLGRGVRYGLGAIIRDTPLGQAYGHSGFFPGYLTEIRYYPQLGAGIAFQVNTSDGRAVGRSTGAIVHDLAEIVAGAVR